jgi:hypothetical protein
MFVLGMGVGLLRTHRSEEPNKDVRYEKGKGIGKNTCVKLDQIIWLIDESPYGVNEVRYYLPTPPRVT